MHPTFLFVIPLFAGMVIPVKFSPIGRALLELWKFRQDLPSYLDIKLPLVAQQFSILRCGRVDGKDAWAVINLS